MELPDIWEMARKHAGEKGIIKVRLTREQMWEFREQCAINQWLALMIEAILHQDRLEPGCYGLCGNIALYVWDE
jgi:hypothetical protein